VTPPAQSCTNHTRKCTRSSLRTHFEDITTQLYKNKSIQALYYKPGPRGLEYISLIVKQASAKASESGYRLKHKIEGPQEGEAKQRLRSKRRRPPAWDPSEPTPGRRLTRSSIHHRRSRRRRGICLLGSTIWSQHSSMGKKGVQSNREYSSKVLSKTYIRTILSMQHF
jgi:hypothetical protein